MSKSKGHLVIAQGGGPTAVINRSLRGVVLTALQSVKIGSVWGSLYGIEGMLKGRWIEMSAESPEMLKAMGDAPASALGSCRKMLNAEESAQAVDFFKKRDVRYFAYIGGNDSMDTANKISQAAKAAGYEMMVFGVPKTIDNDLPHIDHCPGFASAARYYAQSIIDLAMDIRSLPTPISIMEVMGRNAGWLAAAPSLARENDDDAPHLVYVPEVPFSTERFLGDVRKAYEKRGWVIAVVSEGLKGPDGTHLSAGDAAARDGFGHVLPGDVGAFLAREVTGKLKLRARSEKPGLIGRACAMLASPVDRREAEALGRFGMKHALKGNTGFMASLERVSDDPYRVRYQAVDLDKVANVERLLPMEYMNKERNQIVSSFRAYAEPLIGGPLTRYPLLEGFRKNRGKR